MSSAANPPMLEVVERGVERVVPPPVRERPGPRKKPLRGLDALSERLRGTVSRRRVNRAERSRAGGIVRSAQELVDLSESDLNQRIAATADRVRLRRLDAETIGDASAVICETIRREVGLTLYREQVMGGLVIADARCAEMATGEGKTVTAILPVALDAWLGRGVHLHTVNDYLARRDAQITRPAYKRLGLSVGVLQDQTSHNDRKAAYRCDVTYAADKQFIFDYLRDRLATPIESGVLDAELDDALSEQRAWRGRIVQRGLFSAIVDEADSVLIDEAVTPAIIGVDSSEDPSQQAHYRIAAIMSERMDPSRDYRVDRPQRQITLTTAGRETLTGWREELPPFWRGPMRREELLTLALSARELYQLDDDYIVKEGKIVIVDRSTGRILEGRQWQLGIHQAVEAKEDLEISPDRRTASRISYQRFFQQYQRLAGMTGTAWEVAGELFQHYGLTVVRVPTHRPVIRKQARDRILRTSDIRDGLVADRVGEYHAKGRPVLIGTRSVGESERLGEALGARNVPCQILNAQREAQEAEIIAGAGQTGAVTVATNMAGRGTDILLDDRTREHGGLVVISTARNEERRVDRQLFGRAGRQGDPGRAETFVSLEDDLLARHTPKSLQRLCRAMPPLLSMPLARLLFWYAQRTASLKARIARDESGRSDSWLEMALHSKTR